MISPIQACQYPLTWSPKGVEAMGRTWSPKGSWVSLHQKFSCSNFKLVSKQLKIQMCKKTFNFQNLMKTKIKFLET